MKLRVVLVCPVAVAVLCVCCVCVCVCFFLLAFPVVIDFTSTNLMVVSDIVGPYISADSGTANLMVTLDVVSDPCPSVRWGFDGTDITNDSPGYSINNPCGGGSTPPFTFTITIANLTSATSGRYSAVFSNPAFGSTLFHLVVTIPGIFWSA